MKESKGKIILYYLPPSVTEMPLPAFSMLKSFLNRDGYDGSDVLEYFAGRHFFLLLRRLF